MNQRLPGYATPAAMPAGQIYSYVSSYNPFPYAPRTDTVLSTVGVTCGQWSVMTAAEKGVVIIGKFPNTPVSSRDAVRAQLDMACEIAGQPVLYPYVVRPFLPYYPFLSMGAHAPFLPHFSPHFHPHGK